MKKIIVLFFIAVSAHCFAQKDTSVSVTMPVSYWNVIYDLLSKSSMPFNQSYPIITAIQIQVEADFKKKK